jgi:hypothetical protein
MQCGPDQRHRIILFGFDNSSGSVVVRGIPKCIDTKLMSDANYSSWNDLVIVLLGCDFVCMEDEARVIS